MEIPYTMTIGELGQIIAVSTAVIVSLIFGVRSLRQTKYIQENEAKQRLLNEIIEWAVSLHSCQYGKDFKATLDSKTSVEMRKAIYSHIFEHKERFQAMSGRGQYVRMVASSKFLKGSVLSAVEQALKNLENYVEFMDRWQHRIFQDSSLDIEPEAQTGDEYWNKLEESLIKVIEEATRLKTATLK